MEMSVMRLRNPVLSTGGTPIPVQPTAVVLTLCQGVIVTVTAHLTCFGQTGSGGVQPRATGIFPRVANQQYLFTGICGMMTMIFTEMLGISLSGFVYVVSLINKRRRAGSL